MTIRPLLPTPGRITAPETPRARDRLLVAYGWAIGWLLAGYLFLDKAFAYLHVPGTPLYIGEMVLALGIGGLVASTGHLRVPLRDESILLLLVLFLLWGAIRAVPGVGAYGIDAFRDSALWYYGLFAIVIVAALARWPEILDRLWAGLARITPWLLLWLPAAVVLVPFAARAPRVPFSDISVLAHKSGSSATAAVLVVAALWLNPRGRVPGRAGWTMLGLLVIALVATQNRGGLIGALVGASVWLSFHHDRLRMVGKALTIGAIALTLFSLLAVDVPIPGLQGRAFSTSQLVNNVLSLTGSGSAPGNLDGTVDGRQQLWGRVVERQQEQGQMVEGAGFGPNLASDVGVYDEGTTALRTPHNSHLNVLARMGVLGLGIWVALWGGWFWRMIVGARRLGRQGLHTRRQTAALCLTIASTVLVSTFFDPQLEGAQVAALLWTAFGVGVAVTSRSTWFRPPSDAVIRFLPGVGTG
ncbi:O-antigen ligase family protein [Pseudonocardia xishanensis]|uniref:O-antigen ligase-related domain-containing protein n=1 Tax=Pseudonocardia xishanensis TaxID=630995 RepID=A0ABP8S1B1_9PSEU